MSSVRVFFAEMDGSDAMVQSVISPVCGARYQQELTGAPGDRGELPLAHCGFAASPEARCPKKRKAVGRKRTASPAVLAPAAADGGSAVSAHQISALLEKRGMSSGELIAALGAKPADVYYRLGQMRKTGSIETRMDESDAVRRNYLA